MNRTGFRSAALAVAAAATFATGCAGAPQRTVSRPPLQLPAADRFHPGGCHDAADAVLAVGRFTYDHAGANRLTDADRAVLAEQSGRLVAVRDRADPLLADQFGALLQAIGFVRLRTGRTYDPHLLRDVESARVQVQNSCTQARP